MNFESVYNTYFRDVYRYAMSLSGNSSAAEEITEETFMRAMVSLGSFRGECDIKVWLCKIARNCWLTGEKKNARFSDDESALEKTDDGSDIEGKVEDRESAFKIHLILHSIDEPYKEVFSLRVFGELSFKQIGEIFGKNEHWACVTYHRAKEKIQKKFGGGKNE